MTELNSLRDSISHHRYILEENLIINRAPSSASGITNEIFEKMSEYNSKYNSILRSILSYTVGYSEILSDDLSILVFAYTLKASYFSILEEIRQRNKFRKEFLEYISNIKEEMEYIIKKENRRRDTVQATIYSFMHNEFLRKLENKVEVPEIWTKSDFDTKVPWLLKSCKPENNITYQKLFYYN